MRGGGGYPVMAILQTPEERFADVPEFPYDPQYVDVGDVRMAYVEAGEGPETILCLHGEPTWSFLYRKMIPRLSEVGRVVVPDFPGFGRSDKYDSMEDYTVAGLYDALLTFIRELDLDQITLVGQDWGGILGLPAATELPDRFARIVAMNTALPDGTEPMPDTWLEFRSFVESHEDLPIAPIIGGGCVSDLSEDVIAAYEAPFHSPEAKAGARAWPGLVPTDPDDEGVELLRETRQRLAEWQKPAFVLFSEDDPIMRGARDPMRELIPTASEQPDVWIEDAGHFLQEDAGERVAEHVADFIERTPPE